MTYFILCEDRLLPNNELTGPLEFSTEEEASDYISDLDGENTKPLRIFGVKSPKVIRKLFTLN